MRFCSRGPPGGFVDGIRCHPMNRSRRLKLQVFRVVVLVVMGLFFLVPIGAMLEFSTRSTTFDAPRTLDSWTTIATYPALVQAIIASLESNRRVPLSASAYHPGHRPCRRIAACLLMDG